MATLTVTESTDFRGGLAELNITDIVFDTVAQATAEFTPTQFGAGLIANNVEITGDDQANIVQITYAAQGEAFSAAGWQFQDWNPETDVVFIVGIAGGDDTITGSSQNDVIAGGGRLDDIDAGGGNDTIWAGSVFAAGTILDGGTEFAGGFDQLTLLGLGASDLRPANIVDLEQLSFFFSGQTAIVDADQVGGGGFTRIQGASVGTSALTVLDDDVDLSGVTFLSWGADDTITIDGTSNLSNSLIGSSQADNISGNGASADIITGGDGADTLNGGGGADVFWYKSGGDVDAGEVISGGSGTDTIWLDNAGSINFSSATISGVQALDFIAGSSIATLGGDQIGGSEIDAVSGTAGVDALVVNAVDQAASLGGVSFSNWDAADTITINGSGLGDLLGGSGHNDTINGMGGTDSMAGGAGDDTYIVDVSADVIVEANGGGTDLVRSSASYTLSAFQEIENLILTGVAPINGTGNQFENAITGNSGNNVIDGGANADAMSGGAGSDTYVVDDIGDAVTEGNVAGIDLVQSFVTFSLAGGFVENLTLTGAGNVNATGNSLVNTIIGNSGVNQIDGGIGADDMQGGNGNDTYIVDSGGDDITEVAGGGIDTVDSSVTHALAANVENLTLTGVAGTNGTGNALANTITGNSGINRIDGGALGDSMAGGNGNDTYVVDSAGDNITELAGFGIDTVESSVTHTLAANVDKLTLTGSAGTNGTGNALVNTIIGNSGINRIDGSIGADIMQGGGGNDIYVVDSGGDQVIEAVGAGVDSVESSATHTLAANVETLTLTGNAGTNGTGNALANTIIGTSGINRLDGDALNDMLTGGGGSDDFVFDDGDGADTVTDFQNGADQFDLTAVAGIDDIGDLAIIDNGATVTVNYGAGSFTIANLADAGQLDAGDFLF